MKLLEIVHPAAKSLVDVSLAQDAEVTLGAWGHVFIHRQAPTRSTSLLIMQVGDGTTSVVILAGEFLKEAKPFIEEGGHPRVRVEDGRRACCLSLSHTRSSMTFAPSSCMQNIIKAFRMASALAVQKVRDLSISLAGTSDEEMKDLLKKCAMTTLNSKLVRRLWLLGCKAGVRMYQILLVCTSINCHC